jgi:hypothetical protein
LSDYVVVTLPIILLKLVMIVVHTYFTFFPCGVWKRRETCLFLSWMSWKASKALKELTWNGLRLDPNGFITCLKFSSYLYNFGKIWSSQWKIGQSFRVCISLYVLYILEISIAIAKSIAVCGNAEDSTKQKYSILQ